MKKNMSLLWSLLFLATNTFLASAQKIPLQGSSLHQPLATYTSVVESKSDVLSTLISDSSTLRKIATGFGFTEGVQWVQKNKAGYLLFSDMPANVLYKWSPDGSISTYLEKSGYQYHDLWRVGLHFNNGKDPEDPAFESFNLSGSDGLALDRQGRLLIATWTGRSIDRIEHNGTRNVLATHYQNKRLGGTNDLIVNRDGIIYFTDTPGGMLNPDKDPSNELKISGVYMLREDRKPIQIVNDMPNTNGLAFSPDEKILYVNGSIDNYIRRYDVNSDGTLRNGSLLIDFKNEKSPGITDGMKVDSKGNIWTSGPGGLWIISPKGVPLGIIHLPELPINMTFGGPDKKTLFIAAFTSIYAIDTKVSGL